MGRLVVDELRAEGAELGEVPLEGTGTRLLAVGAGWEGGRAESVFLLRFVPRPKEDFKREVMREIGGERNE